MDDIIYLFINHFLTNDSFLFNKKAFTLIKIYNKKKKKFNSLNKKKKI